MGTTYYFLPTRNLFGEDSVKETGSLMQSLGGKKTLIVTDAFLAKQGMARMVQDILKDSGVESVVFGGVESNPKDVNVEAGLKVFKENGCDSIISLGGGSSHDCAKGIGIVASNGGNINCRTCCIAGNDQLCTYFCRNNIHHFHNNHNGKLRCLFI